MNRFELVLLFDKDRHGKHFRAIGDLMKVIDATNKRFGGKIKFGNNDLNRRWKMKQEKLSPCYSTRFEDIIIVNCK